MSEHNENLVILEEPIQRGDTLIEQIEIIKPNAGHLRGIGLAALANADVDTLTTLLPRITVPNLTPQDCKTLSLPDLVELAGKVVGFLSPKSAQ
ncbi:phage tail assembly protein [Ewingella americana]